LIADYSLLPHFGSKSTTVCGSRSRIAVPKATFSKKICPLHQQIGLNFQEETSKALDLEYSFVWCKEIINSWKMLKCGAGEEWRKSAGTIL